MVMKHTNAIKFKIWVVNWPRNLVKIRDRKSDDDDDDHDNEDDEDNVISKHVDAIKYYNKGKKSYVGDKTHQFGMEVHKVIHVLCLQHYVITHLMLFSLFSRCTTFSRPVA
jgi:hypothetical protein